MCRFKFLMKELCTVHCSELAYLFAENWFYRCESGLEYLHPPRELRKKPGQLCFGTCTSTGRWPWNCTTQPGPPGGVGGAPCSWLRVAAEKLFLGEQTEKWKCGTSKICWWMYKSNVLEKEGLTFQKGSCEFWDSHIEIARRNMIPNQRTGVCLCW